HAYNCDYIEVTNLVFTGSGSNNSGAGVFFYTDLPGNVKLDHIVIDHVEATGFEYGIRVGAWNGQTGFRNGRITNNQVHHNIRTGINIFGIFNNSLVGAHEDFYIANNVAHHNLGDPTDTASHSGNGIVIGGVQDVVIEHNTAYENGGLNPNFGGGPVGIWAYDCNRITIQFNESYSNHTGPNAVDGGGFDLDQGCSNSVMQYNFSHNNDGAGFLVWQNSGGKPMSNNVVRYNISENDGRHGNYGGITVGG
ncbi:MAG: right-handed parallel beta-helix repeat-containing protein, partial [Chloroflexi bacterium]|nr:right-handed parallel beta-helix repeat-containing protein [Chloroflexota bacterium]